MLLPKKAFHADTVFSMLSAMGRTRNKKAGRLSTPVFVFDDYVDFLQAWYGYAKRFGVTQKSFVEKAGVGTQAYFSDVLARRKNSRSNLFKTRIPRPLGGVRVNRL